MQNDFNDVIQWIFAQLNAVLDFISHYYILRIALFVPIAGGLIVAVFYMLQVFDIGKYSIFKFGKNKPFTISSMSFGSVQSISVRGASHSLVTQHRKKVRDEEREAKRKAEQAEREAKRKAEQAEREAKREAEKAMYKKHETIYFDEQGNMVKSTSFHRNTLEPAMSEFEKSIKPISKSESYRNIKKSSESGSISRKPTYDLDSIKERIMNNTEI